MTDDCNHTWAWDDLNTVQCVKCKTYADPREVGMR